MVELTDRRGSFFEHLQSQRSTTYCLGPGSTEKFGRSSTPGSEHDNLLGVFSREWKKLARSANVANDLTANLPRQAPSASSENAVAVEFSEASPRLRPTVMAPSPKRRRTGKRGRNALEKSGVSSSFLPRVSISPRCQFIILARKDELTSRQEARGRRIVTTVKPFAGTLRVTNPVR